MMFSRRPGVRFGRRSAENAARALAPGAVPGCVLWIDMQDASAYAQSGGTMESVTNKMSGVVWSDPAVANLPTFSAGGLNGRDCMDFELDNSEAIMSTEAAVWQAFRSGNDYTVFMVLQNEVAAQSNVALGFGDDTEAGSRLIGNAVNRYRNSFVNDDVSFTVNQTDTGTNDTNPHVHMWRVSGGQIVLEIDGVRLTVTPATQVPSVMTLSRAALGCRPDPVPDNFYDGRAGEWAAYGRALSASEVAGVTRYLLAGWGI